MDSEGAGRQNKHMAENLPKKRRKYDESFKRECVAHWRKSGRPRERVAEELGINHWLLRTWDRQFRSQQAPPPTALTKTELESENQRLREELRRVQEQRDILKKTLGILSTP
jgi:transposase